MEHFVKKSWLFFKLSLPTTVKFSIKLGGKLLQLFQRFRLGLSHHHINSIIIGNFRSIFNFFLGDYGWNYWPLVNLLWHHVFSQVFATPDISSNSISILQCSFCSIPFRIYHYFPIFKNPWFTLSLFYKQRMKFRTSLQSQIFSSGCLELLLSFQKNLMSVAYF